MRPVLIIFAVFAAAPLLIGLIVSIASFANASSGADVLLPLPVFMLAAVAASVFIMASGFVVALVLRALEQRQR